MAPQQQQQSAQDCARKLLEVFEGAAQNVVVDTAEDGGIFGQLYEPCSVMESLLTVATTEENVGVPSLPPPVAVHSQTYEAAPFLDLLSTTGSSLKKWHQVPIRICNFSRSAIRIRWIDQNYGKRSSHSWNIRPHAENDASPETWKQHCSPGHLFLLSIVNNEGNEIQAEEEEDLFSAYDHDYISPSLSQETVLGALRPLRPLPSGVFLSVVIRQDESTGDMVLETVIDNIYDALVVAAAALDPYNVGSEAATTIKLLTTVLSNIKTHPGEEKYQRLRKSNPKIQKYLCNSWGAVQFLTLCGFEQKTLAVEENSQPEEYLVIPPEDGVAIQHDALSQALKLLEILSSRAVPGFVPDLAPPTPWEPSRPVAGNGGGSKNRRWAENQDRRMGFVTAEERWARAERVNRNRRNGRARRPNPGNAPSSRGNWGR